MVKIAQLMIPQPPGVENIVIFACPRIIFGKVGQSSFFVKFDTTMPCMVKIAQLMIPQPPGVENIVIFAIRAAVSEIQLFLTLNGKLALIGY